MLRMIITGAAFLVIIFVLTFFTPLGGDFNYFASNKTNSSDTQVSNANEDKNITAVTTNTEAATPIITPLPTPTWLPFVVAQSTPLPTPSPVPTIKPSIVPIATDGKYEPTYTDEQRYQFGEPTKITQPLKNLSFLGGPICSVTKPAQTNSYNPNEFSPDPEVKKLEAKIIQNSGGYKQFKAAYPNATGTIGSVGVYPFTYADKQRIYHFVKQDPPPNGIIIRFEALTNDMNLYYPEDVPGYGVYIDICNQKVLFESLYIPKLAE